MTKILLYNDNYTKLYPLTYTRSTLDLKLGYYTIREKWYNLFSPLVSNLALSDIKSIPDSSLNDYEHISSKKYSNKKYNDEIYIKSSIIPSKELANLIMELPKMTKLVDTKNNVIAYRNNSYEQEFNIKVIDIPILRLNNIWDVVSTDILTHCIHLDIYINMICL